MPLAPLQVILAGAFRSSSNSMRGRKVETERPAGAPIGGGCPAATTGSTIGNHDNASSLPLGNGALQELDGFGFRVAKEECKFWTHGPAREAKGKERLNKSVQVPWLTRICPVWWPGLTTALNPSIGAPAGASVSTFRPRIELLEDRNAPANITWSGASGIDTNWSRGANWFGNVAPGVE